MLSKIFSFSDMWMEGKENTEGYNSKIVSDIRSMSDVEKKAFFNKVDAAGKGKQEGK